MGLLMGTKPIDASGTKPDAGVGSLSDLVLRFFEEDDTRWPKRPDLIGSSDDDDVEEAAGESAAERKAFWDAQLHLLNELLSTANSTESRLRRTTESAVSSLRADSSSACSCSGSPSPTALPCRSCTLRLLSARLRRAGHDAAVCLSRWRATPSSPAGDHAYLDVVLAPAPGATPNGKAPRRLIVEPAFRAEFEMARACPEYSALVALLPEVFVGRAERLRGILKLVCAAAKKCLTDNGMHVAPWRKQRYMVAKWLSAPVERRAVEGVDEAKLVREDEKAAAGAVSLFPPARRSPRLRASMLTYDLLDGKLPASTALCTAVEVV